MENKEVFYSDGEVRIGKSRLHRIISKSTPLNKEQITKKDYDLLTILINEDVEYSSLNLFDKLKEWFEVVAE